VGDSDIDLSGASKVKIAMDGTLNARLSGASALEYAGNVVLGRKSTWGASKIRRAYQYAGHAYCGLPRVHLLTLTVQPPLLPPNRLLYGVALITCQLGKPLLPCR